METGKAIYYLLKDSSDVGAICGDRIYPEIAQQDAPVPFVAYSVSSTTPSGTKSSSSQLDTARVDLFIISDDYAEAMNLAIAVRNALDRQGGDIGPDGETVAIQSIDFESSDTDHDVIQDVYIVEHTYNVRVQRAGVIAGYNVLPGNAIGIREADGTPSGNVTNLVVTNGTLTVDGNEATLNTGGGGTLTVREEDGTPSDTATTVVVPNGSLTVASNVATLDLATGDELTAETTARTNADTTLQNNIDAEATVRATVDSALQDNINSEATARTTADTTLQNNIDAEATTRANADTTLQNNIDAEATTRANADTTLQNNIDAEATTRANADTTLQNNIDNLTIEDVDNTGILEQLAEQLADLNGLSSSDFPNGLIGDFNQDGYVGSADLVVFLGYFESSLSDTERSSRISSYVGISGDPLDPVRSINNETADRDGDVNLTTSELPEGSRLYYTDARADARISAALISDLSDTPAGIGSAGQVLSVNAARTGYEFTNKTAAYTSPYELRTLTVSAPFLFGGSSQQNFTNSTPLQVALNTSVATYNANSTTMELNGVTIDEDGVYRFTFSAEFASSSAFSGDDSTPAAYFYVNNTKQLGTSHGYIPCVTGVDNNSVNLTRVLQLNEQDFFEVRVYDSSTAVGPVGCTSAVLDVERLA